MDEASIENKVFLNLLIEMSLCFTYILFNINLLFFHDYHQYIYIIYLFNQVYFIKLLYYLQACLFCLEVWLCIMAHNLLASLR